MEVGVLDERACRDESDIGLVNSQELSTLDMNIQHTRVRTHNKPNCQNQQQNKVHLEIDSAIKRLFLLRYRLIMRDLSGHDPFRILDLCQGRLIHASDLHGKMFKVSWPTLKHRGGSLKGD